MLTEDAWKHYVVGVCPGELGRPVAIAVATQAIRLGHRRATDTVDVGHLELVPAGTDLQATADHLAAILAALALTEQGEGGVTLVLDISRLGKALVELVMKAGRVPRVVEITAGGRGERGDGGTELLPRRELTAGLSVAFNAGKVRVAPALPLASRFSQALGAFQTRAAVPPDPFEAARMEANEMLVLAVGLCAWLAGREVPGLRGVPIGSRRSGLGDYDPHARWRD